MIGGDSARDPMAEDLSELSPVSASSVLSVEAAMTLRADNKTPAKKKVVKRSSLDEDDFFNLLHGSDPVKIELNRLLNDVKDKDRELAEAQIEIKALQLTERVKEKALVEVTEELEKMLKKFQASEVTIENKNLEIKRILDEKKEALAAQFAAEAALRRVHAAQKDEELPPLDVILSPLEAEIKFLRHECSKLQEDNRALERLTKSKEAALLDAEREVQVAKLKAALVDELQNRNHDLIKQVDISQEEYKILDRMHRQKVVEVEKLGQTVHELEEALLSRAAVANTVRDYQRQVSELKGEKKTLERTLSRAKVTENRVALVVANEWKDDDNKVMPVKQWLEERRCLMGEMQQYREKLSIAERAAKIEAQLKEKFQLRLKVVEDGLKSSLRSGFRPELLSSFVGTPRSQSSTGSMVKKSPATLSRSSTISSTSSSVMLKHAKGASRSFDGVSSSDGDRCKIRLFGDAYVSRSSREGTGELFMSNTSGVEKEPTENKRSDAAEVMADDYVSGAFYDLLQKEVIALRKACYEKDQNLKDKDDTVEILSKKIDTLTKAMEVEAKKMRREKAAMEKEVASLRTEHEQKLRTYKGAINNHQMTS
ncbi:Microtubule-associated protein 70-2 [Acorus gramineus]|uniref:Microtubule-associated protein 70-2 n=1 Tax=Acorus gramineus TaxID=55184 RepID=A0AAV9BT30_ACOGR|nr:Microtubule-associated protein 70-2 [Acorus gramineus]